MSTRKPFDKDLFEKYDKLGRDVVKRHFEKLNMQAQDNPDRYGVDLLVYRDEKIVSCAEVEVRLSWNSDEFPFDSLNVPSRKKKLLTNQVPTLFFSINKPLTRMFWCPSTVVLNSPLEEVKNKYVDKDEYFYKVPLNSLVIEDITNGNS